MIFIYEGENPAQSVAYVNRNGNKLYGVQLGDGYGRLGNKLIYY